MRTLLCAFTVIFLAPTISYSAPTVSITASAEGKCRLYNEKSDNYKYEGKCDIKQEKSDSKNEYDITLGNGDSYRFIEEGSKYKVKTPQGWSDHMAIMTDSGNVATFEWYKWKLTADIGDAMKSSSETTAEVEEAGTENSAIRAGQGNFDATGKIPCAQAKGQPMGQCPFGVARDGDGTATVSVTLPDGRKRAIFFDNGKAAGADLSQADGNMDFSYTKEADLYMIKAGNERYEIPEAVIYGG